MPTTAPRQQSNFKPAPAGTHIARCYQFIQIGKVEESFMGEVKMMNKIRLSFELPNELETFKEGSAPKPVVVSKEFTLSMGSKANLRKFIEGMYGVSFQDHEADAFDVETLVGQACLLSIKHLTTKKGSTFADIAGASPLMKGQIAPGQVNPSKILTYTNWDEEFFMKLPEFIRNKMEGSEEYHDMRNPMSQTDKDRIEQAKANHGRTEVQEDLKAEDIPF